MNINEQLTQSTARKPAVQRSNNKFEGGRKKSLVKSLMASAVLLATPLSMAGPIQLMLESNTNRQGGAEIFMAEFVSSVDLSNGALSDGAFSQINVGANFSVGGMSYDNTGYHVLLESDENRQGGSEIYLASFQNYDDLLSGSLSNGSFSQLNLGANFGVGGFTYDGSEYHLLLESDENRQGGSEIFMASFANYDDLLTGSLSQGGFSQLNIGANFSVGGMTFNGGLFDVLLESDANRQGGSEIFQASFASFDDLMAGSLLSGSFSQLNVGAGFSVGGLVALPDPDDGYVGEVPEPGSFALFAVGAGLLGFVRGRATKNTYI